MLVLFLLISLLLPGLAGATSVGERSFKWEHQDIRVCWQDETPLKTQDFSLTQTKRLKNLRGTLITLENALKEEIKELVIQEFSAVRTGIHFVGWEKCESTSHYDAVIMTGRSSHYSVPLGRANLGRCDDIDAYSVLEDSQKGFIYLNTTQSSERTKVSPRDLLLRTALHEFGHLAGLRHEHIRPEAIDDVSCDAGDERPDFKTDYFTAYDPTSIMNYCFTDIIQKKLGMKFLTRPGISPSIYQDETIVTQRQAETHIRLGLSLSDVHGLRCLYVFNDEERKASCHGTFSPSLSKF